MEFFTIILAFTYFLMIFCYAFFRRQKNGLPTDWPMVGMLPGLLKNVYRINDFCVDLLDNSQQSFLFKGPWFTGMELLLTVNPRNIHYIMSKNFGNYPKGAKFNEIFDVLGDGIFNADGELWKHHRKVAQTFVGHPQFHTFLGKQIHDKIEKGLIPVLDHVSKQGLVVDLQDMFEKFTFDNICALTMGYELGSLCVDLPSVPSSKALDDLEEVILYRHFLPMGVWKFIRWLGVGKERTFKQAWEILDGFIYKCIAKKQQEMKQASPKDQNEEVGVDILTLYKDKDDKFLRDTILNLFIAGRDTTSTALSWFFYLLSNNPHVKSKIRHELIDALSLTRGGVRICALQDTLRNNKLNELSDKLVYLHGALCEALRLYPPVVFQAKTPIEQDTLPSGHQVKPHMQVIFNLYAMARMQSIWGDDCCEFKPERWISQQGKIKHEPSYKFTAFNAGPRTCVGKDMAFTQMKLVAATIILNYEFHAVEGHPVVPDPSIILRMKHGFKVKVVNLI